jgi:hypothetical protein
MFAKPAVIPVTTPVVPTTATEVVLLLHVPAAGVALKVVVDPSQTTAEPPTAEGNELTVTKARAVQPVLSV